MITGDQDFMIVIHTNFITAIHGFHDNEVLLPIVYEVIVSPPPGGAARTFKNGFWKSDHDLLIVFYSKFLSGMYGFRVNEVLLPSGYDVIVSPLPGGAARTSSWRILKERSWLPARDP